MGACLELLGHKPGSVVARLALALGRARNLGSVALLEPEFARADGNLGLQVPPGPRLGHARRGLGSWSRGSFLPPEPSQAGDLAGVEVSPCELGCLEPQESVPAGVGPLGWAGSLSLWKPEASGAAWRARSWQVPGFPLVGREPPSAGGFALVPGGWCWAPQ